MFVFVVLSAVSVAVLGSAYAGAKVEEYLQERERVASRDAKFGRVSR